MILNLNNYYYLINTDIIKTNIFINFTNTMNNFSEYFQMTGIEIVNSQVGTLKLAVAKALNLNISEVSDADTFYELGGDSLAALYVIEDLVEKNLELDPIDLSDDLPLSRVALGIKVISDNISNY